MHFAARAIPGFIPAGSQPRFEENLASEILISSDPWENRVAILEDGTLAELYIEREEKVIGSIYKGKVQNVLPGMGAAFVDIGLGRNAFLYVDDINKQPLNIGDVEITHGHSGFTIGEKVKRGDDVLVQIVKEPRGLKGARISTNISLPGRYLILMPTGKYSGVSRKIESADERNRLKSVMKRIRPEGMATVVRTAAAGVSEAELIADLGVLIRMWHGILETFKRAASPSLLHRDMNLIYKAARDFVTADVDKVLIDNEQEYRKIREFLQLLGPQYLDRVEYYNSGRNLFDDYKITEELQKLMKPKINLPSGGSIVIESTEALTVIDVNSGKFTGGKNLEDTIAKTNLEAASEIARQVRLRDIGGIIVVDFIDMASEASRSKVIKALEDGLRLDRTRATIQSFSNLGLLEFTRKRVGKDLGAQLRGTCPTCTGLGSVMSSQSVAIETFRKIRSLGSSNGHAHGEIVANVAPWVASQMDFWYDDECVQLGRELDSNIHVRVDPLLHPEHARIERIADMKQINAAAIRVGDEHGVELLVGRLPNPTSAAAVVNGHIVEVENAANNAGNLARIRIIDIEDSEDYVLAELMTSANEAAKKKRVRGKRKGALTASEQAQQLRELAEEAASQQQARPPIGITTVTEEEEKQDRAVVAEARGEEQEDAILIGAADLREGGRNKRRRRRGRGRGRGTNGAPGFEAVAQAGIPAQSAAVQGAEDDEDDEGDEKFVAPAVSVGAPQPSSQEPGLRQDESGDGKHRRRRRRRRRGRGGASGTSQGPAMPGQSVEPPTGALPTLPDRHVFRVGADGEAHPTGITAPREPSRAIEPVRGAKPPAVEAPPPHLTLPQEEPRVTKPARRRRTAASPSPAFGGEIEATAPQRALPPAPATETPPAKPKRTTRTKKAETVSPAPPAEKPKRTPAKAAATSAKRSEAKPKRAPRKKAEPATSPSPTKKPSARKKPAATATRKKK
ncbi:MAG: Rne/Rng family ribonuclease [Candidatus Eremiobacteraeota bacterium]|nr:Rne/Rng family ribonuclease [Candidatus Eremiobacteraeota bacterium]